MLVPYLASAEIYAHRLFGGDAPVISARDLARCRILSAGREITLSVPLVGGSHLLSQNSKFKIENSKFEDILLSDHGDWQRRHISALTTAYSRTPFFDHYAPSLFSIIENSTFKIQNSTLTLGSFLRALDARILSFLPFSPSPHLPTSPSPHLPTSSPTFLALCHERRGELRPGLSILDLLFRFGPEAIFPLCGALL